MANRPLRVDEAERFVSTGPRSTLIWTLRSVQNGFLGLIMRVMLGRKDVSRETSFGSTSLSHMSGGKMDVFFYGLFMDSDLLESQGLRPHNPRNARIDDYVLRIGERATLVPAEGETAYGIVMGLTEGELTRLYAEPSVCDYRRQLLKAHLEGHRNDKRPLTVHCYLLPAGQIGGEVNQEYAAKLAALASRLGLPSRYIKEIERIGY